MGIKVTGNVIFYSYGTMKGYIDPSDMGSNCSCERVISQAQLSAVTMNKGTLGCTVYSSMSCYLRAFKHQYEQCGHFNFHFSQLV